MILQLISRMTSYQTRCQFCDRSHEEVQALVVRETTRASICDDCAQDVIDTARKHLETPGA